MKPERRTKNRVIETLVYCSAALTALLLVTILGYVLWRGLPHISWAFLTQSESVLRDTMGIFPLIVNTLCIILLSLLLALPIGVGAAIYLTEYAAQGILVRLIEYTTETLSAIPSIIYGLAGSLVFVQLLGGASLVAGALTLVVMILPIIIRTTQESLKTVPQSYREGALALGASKWHMIRTIILPAALDGILTGCLLSIGRIVGESAALLFTAGSGKLLANSLMDIYYSSGATLSVGLYLYAFEEGRYDVAYAVAAVLLVLVLLINLCAKLVKRKLHPNEQKKTR